MPLILRNDEQIQVDSTVGLASATSSFVFDGTGGKPDYRGFDIVITETLGGRGVMVHGLDYSWNSITGQFNLLQAGDLFQPLQWYNVHFQYIQPSIVVNPTSIIDASFFIRDISIPNATVEPILGTLNLFIDKYEPICLRALLGYALYERLKVENSLRITNLLYGADYTDTYSISRHWQGLVHDNKISLIANYIYFEYQQFMATQSTGTATSIPNAKQGKTVSPALKMVEAWKFMQSEMEECFNFLWSNLGVYTEVTNETLAFTQGYFFSSSVNEFDL